MRIHEVQSGESLWEIAQDYGVSVQSIIDINGLNEIPHLIPGQALVIPTFQQQYTVRQGDSLWEISRQFDVSLEALIALNNIQNPDLIYPGMVLNIPGTSEKFGSIEVNAYIDPTGDSTDATIVNDVGRYLTYISPFSYQVNENATLTAPRDNIVLNTARQYDIAPLMVLTNFRNGNFDAQLAHRILSSETLQNTLINNTLNVLREKNYYGLNIDFERIPPEDRQLYNNFLRRVVDSLRPQGYPVSTALVPKSYDIQEGEWHGAHDYRAHGEIVDFVILMTYEYGWAGGPPMAVAPINEVRKVLDYATSVMPSNKIMMGIPLYGYDWTLPYTPGGRWARSLSPQEALQLAARYGASIQYDNRAQAPYFHYWDEEGREHVVWFEDARSIRNKLFLVDEYNLRGISYWVLGGSFPQNWAVLEDMFTIVKK